jgi:hypothetical protein
MKKTIWLLALLPGFIFLACSGGGSEEKTMDETTSSSSSDETTSSTGESDGDAPANLQDAMKEAEKAMKNVQTAEPVNFRELQELLPEKLAGYERKSKAGETTGAFGMTISRAEAKYADGDCDAKVELIDTGGIAMGIMGMAAWSSTTIDKEDENGYERTSTLDGYKCFEKFRKNGNSSELSVLVENRFVVSTSGRNCDMDQLKKLVKGMDLGKLKKLG